jgi:hypothetical protein
MIDDCKHCGKPFKYWEAGAGGWGSRGADDIDCPDCGRTHGRQETAGDFDSEAHRGRGTRIPCLEAEGQKLGPLAMSQSGRSLIQMLTEA